MLGGRYVRRHSDEQMQVNVQQRKWLKLRREQFLSINNALETSIDHIPIEQLGSKLYSFRIY